MCSRWFFDITCFYNIARRSVLLTKMLSTDALTIFIDKRFHHQVPRAATYDAAQNMNLCHLNLLYFLPTRTAGQNARAKPQTMILINALDIVNLLRFWFNDPLDQGDKPM